MAGSQTIRRHPAWRRLAALSCGWLATAAAWAQPPAGPMLAPPGTAPPAAAPQAGAPPTGLPSAADQPALPEEAADDTVVEVRVVGLRNVALAKVQAAMTTRKGRVFDQATFEKDVRKLAQKRWFVDIKPSREFTPRGVVVTINVVERPVLEAVQYVGNQSIGSSKLAKETELRKGQPLDIYAVTEGRRKIEEYYQSKGYASAHVSIIEGDKPQDRKAVYLINEGGKQRIWSVKFKGNTIEGDSRLKTQIESKPPILMLFKGYVDRKKIEEDKEKLLQYYRALGFFRAVIEPELEYDEEHTWLTLTFHISEGPRYKVRSVALSGNQKYAQQQLTPDLKLSPGMYFDQNKMNQDVQLLRDRYGSVGHVFADIQAEPRFLLEPGELDLMYVIHEGDQYRVSRVNVYIDGDESHTRHQAVLNRVQLRPGDIVDIRKIRASQVKLKASGLFNTDPTKGSQPRIVFSPPTGAEGQSSVAGRPQPSAPADRVRGQSPDGVRQRDVDVEFFLPPLTDAGRAQLDRQNQAAPSRAPRGAGSTTIRGQSPDGNSGFGGQALRGVSPDEFRPRGPSAAGAAPRAALTRPVAAPAPLSRPMWEPRYLAQSPGPAPYNPWGGTAAGSLAPGASPRVGAPTGQPVWANPPSAAAAGDVAPAPAPGAGSPLLNTDPQGNLIVPDPNAGYLDPPEKYIPIDAHVEETQTGRLMLGVGINSDAGLIGNVIIDEQNFDISRFPTSFQDFVDGVAFRGAGQRLRIEAAPGTQVQRYLVNFVEPYLLDTPVSLGLSGFFYNRIYRDWREERLGGRVTTGYNFSPDLSGTLAFRAERVNIFDPRVSVPELDEVLGKSKLYSIRPALAHDTRDNTFLATQGHFLEVGFEQAFGDFDFPRATLDARKYFVLSERPDGSGRQVLSVSGKLGVSGKDTPLYEHFFAGGFSTMRGFAFRGASPVTGGVVVGGEFQALGTVEYLFPITADDMLRGVVFCDFGTVERTADVSSDNFRAAPGFGFRISIPALGPAPIALDFAFPVASAPTDDEQVFSFFIGFGRN